MNQPNIENLVKSADTFNVELPKGSVQAAVDALHAHFAEVYGEDTLAACQMCGNDSPEYTEAGKSIDECPFCGTLFDGPANEEIVVMEKPKTKKKKVAKKPKATSVPRKKTGKKEAKPAAEETAIERTPDMDKKLESHVATINKLRSNIAVNAYDIGIELNEIRDNSLWEGMGYKSFFVFCAQELDFSRSGAYKYMVCAREFDRETFLTVGVKKGELIASAPDQHKKKLMTAAEKGASHTDLKAKLNKYEGKTSAPKGADKLTLLGRVNEGDVEVAWLSSKTHEAITRRNSTNRYGRLKLTDEVEVTIIENDDGLGLTVSFRRID